MLHYVAFKWEVSICHTILVHYPIILHFSLSLTKRSTSPAFDFSIQKQGLPCSRCSMGSDHYQVLFVNMFRYSYWHIFVAHVLWCLLGAWRLLIYGPSTSYQIISMFGGLNLLHLPISSFSHFSVPVWYYRVSSSFFSLRTVSRYVTISHLVAVLTTWSYNIFWSS